MRKKCILCGEILESALFVLNNAPMGAQHMPEKIDNIPGGVLRLHQCKWCGLIQLDNEPVSYYRDVIRSGGFSKAMLDIRRGQFSKMIDKYHLEGKKIIEVGCGAGEYLQVLQEYPVEAYGVEHEEVLAKKAVGNGIRVQCGFAETEDTLFEGGPFDAFLSFNFIEHMPFPNTYLKAIYNNLKQDAVGLITVPSWEYIEKNGACFELIRDHIAYYTLDTLSLLLQNNGFEVLEKWQDSFTLQVTVRKRNRVQMTKLTQTYDNMSGILDAYAEILKKEGRQIAIWGASHETFTFVATTSLGKTAKYIIDSATFKQGKYAPVTYLPIVSPDYFETHPVNSILIIALWYIDEIAADIRKKWGESVEVLALSTEYTIKVLRSVKDNELIWEDIELCVQ